MGMGIPLWGDRNVLELNSVIIVQPVSILKPTELYITRIMSQFLKNYLKLTYERYNSAYIRLCPLC